MSVLCTAMHGAILAAYRHPPPRLDEAPFFVVVAVFVAGIVASALRFPRQFKRIDA